MTEEIFRDDSYAKSCEATIVAINDGGIVLDRTVFYPRGGGQPGDSGVFRGADGRLLPIADTVTDKETGALSHVPGEPGDPGGTVFAVGDVISAEIDWDRRFRHMRVHSCLHLLCNLINSPVTGAAISAEKGRIDFNLQDTSLDKEALGIALARLIDEDHPLSITWISDDDLAAQPQLVRTMSVKPPVGRGKVRLVNVEGIDLQPCGGTHVKSTGEIGGMRIGKIENKGRQNRRVNVVFGD